jgi:hypothetical protein
MFLDYQITLTDIEAPGLSHLNYPVVNVSEKPPLQPLLQKLSGCLCPQKCVIGVSAARG